MVVSTIPFGRAKQIESFIRDERAIDWKSAKMEERVIPLESTNSQERTILSESTIPIELSVPAPYSFVCLRRRYQGGFMAYLELESFHSAEGQGATPQEAIDAAAAGCDRAKAAWLEELASRPPRITDHRSRITDHRVSTLAPKINLEDLDL